jgi:transcriptional regulator with XRE-family HTH domain
MSTARSALADALREARQSIGLTQEELGRHIGVKGRAVYRWERDDAQPNRANQRRVVEVIASLHEAAAAKLSAVIADQVKHAPVATAPPPRTATPPAALRALVEHSVFSVADELDLPPRRVRAALAGWLRRVHAAGLALDVVQREIDAWIGDAQ